ncbi:MAG: phage baseplate assembly protein V [Pseudomonadota bacterium]
MLSDLTFRLTELERRLANVLRLGIVYAADYPAARVRVKTGDLITGWLPWLTHRAGGDRTWHAPEIGEQVLLLAPNGEPAQGVVLPAIYRDAAPAPADSPDISRTLYADGTVASYDRTTRTMTTTIDQTAITATAQDMTLAVGGSSIHITPDAITAIAPVINLNR